MDKVSNELYVATMMIKAIILVTQELADVSGLKGQEDLAPLMREAAAELLDSGEEFNTAMVGTYLAAGDLFEALDASEEKMKELGRA